jgi:flavin reductase (DIM6/NTAB) family NADH-FMN oxidoreductase RutF
MVASGDETTPDMFKVAMSCFATGVAVVTARDDRGIDGFTANALFACVLPTRRPSRVFMKSGGLL